MKAKPVVPREQANRDIDQAIAYYLGEDAGPAALGFIDALQQAYGHIGRHPATGLPRYAHELNLPGLRCWPLTRYPYGNAEKFRPWNFLARRVAVQARNGLHESMTCVIDSCRGILPRTGSAE